MRPPKNYITLTCVHPGSPIEIPGKTFAVDKIYPDSHGCLTVCQVYKLRDESDACGQKLGSFCWQEGAEECTEKELINYLSNNFNAIDYKLCVNSYGYIGLMPI